MSSNQAGNPITFIHNAVYKLRKDLTPTERDVFATEIGRLAKIPYLPRGFAVTPAQTERRSVADHSFDFATSFHFRSLQDRDFYQTKCEHHARFASICQPYWERVVIYHRCSGRVTS